ncbi:lipase 3-like [Toxorhynchites rutilus septentrionalis]|uniref:lipase 3-like n=1 Tax=Toxorhynchites rutilus septentrionalis TaxID=329112 RepID=UPI002479C901|nr:lipase 3-like [Toxorhynchites rutilus septentrionalis]
MKVIPQLVLIVIPCLILTEANNGHDDGLSVVRTSDTRVTDRRRLSEFERDLVIDAIETAGYPSDLHVVTTQDGYILKLHRIPDPSLDSTDNSGRGCSSNHQFTCFQGVVLLMHGLFSTAADFVVTGPENGLAFILADAGYDVWMGNARGTRFSRQNLHVSAKSGQFWDFSWHEIGTSDLPATIDYILRKTRQRKLYYIGHNQGVTAILALLAEKPKYNQKISGVAAMAPIAYLGNGESRGILRSLAKFNDQIWVTMNALNIFELTPSEGIMKFISNIICSEESLTREVCSDLLAEMFGYTSEQAKQLLPGVVENWMTGISSKQLVHYGQLMQSKKFQQFDYKNFVTNMQRYKFGKPPEYNLSKISVPWILFYGTKDFFTSSVDFKMITKALPNVKHYFELPNWTHIDFIYNAQIYAQVYSRIIQTMRNSAR